MEMTPEDLMHHIVEIDESTQGAQEMLLIDLLVMAYPAKVNQDN